MDILDQLYKDIILEHNSNKKNKGELSDATSIERGHNPNCGDDLTLMVKVDGNTISDAKFAGMGCAISTASMSIMIDLVKGKTVDEARQLSDIFLKMIKGETLEKADKRKLKDAAIFESLKDMPARVKCGTLGWHCLNVVVSE